MRTKIFLMFIAIAYSANCFAFISSNEIQTTYNIMSSISRDSIPIETLKNLANKGNVEATLELGKRFANGIGVEENLYEASIWYQAAAEKGNEEGLAWCADYFYKLSRGYNPSSPDFQKIGLMEKAGRYGNVEAMYEVGKIYKERLDPWKRIRDPETAMAWLKAAADRKHIKASFEYAQLKLEQYEEDSPEVINYLKYAADSGYATACYYLGKLYEKGKFVTANKNLMIKYIRMAANKNLNEAMYTLGAYYYLGKGVPKNLKEAYKWFHKAERNGYNHAIPMANKLRKMGYR